MDASETSPTLSGGDLAIETVGLAKHFGETRAVDGLDLTVPAGGAEVTFVLYHLTHIPTATVN
jgi:hypothetical protein